MEGYWFTIGFLPLFAALLMAEALRPIHLQPRDPKGRLSTNFGLGILNALLIALLPLSSVAAAVWASVHGFGLMNRIILPAPVSFALALLVRSLVAYVAHWASHRIPLLWRLHRVHHSDIAVDLSTGFRHHPLELIVVAACYAGTSALLGLPVAAVATYETVSVAFALWTHANLRMPLVAERFMQLLIATPAMHHIHHSARGDETDSNYGELLSLWDRLFGTYRCHDLEGLRAIRFGLGSSADDGAANFTFQLRSPFNDSPRGNRRND